MIKLLRILLVTSLTALGAFVVLPLPYVVWGEAALPGATDALTWKRLAVGLFYPSAQLVGVWIAASWLGARAGVTSMVLYLLLGLFGLPVFIDGGGLDYGKHGALLPLLTFPLAAWLGARVRGPGTGRRTFWGILSATLVISLAAVVNQVAQTGHWLDLRQWQAFAAPQLQSLLGWVALMGLFSLGAAMAHRVHSTFAPPAPEPQPEPESEDVAPTPAPVAVGYSVAQRHRALPPSLTENAKRLADPSKPRLPDR